jgi:hypothetical protein
LDKPVAHYLGRLLDIFVIPLAPRSWRLGLQYLKHVFLLSWEPEVRLIGKLVAGSSGMAVDVGANMGLWTYAMVRSKRFGSVLAVEPNRALTHCLQDANMDNVHILHKAISDRSGAEILRIPKTKTMLLTGWATLEKRVDIDVEGYEECSIEAGCRIDKDRCRGPRVESIGGGKGVLCCKQAGLHH